MYKVLWNRGKAQQLFITYPEAKLYKEELEEDGEDNVFIRYIPLSKNEEKYKEELGRMR